MVESQSGLVKGKQTLDGILVSNEVVDEAKKKKNELILFKVISIRRMIHSSGIIWTLSCKKMCLSKKWYKWILECVSSTLISMLINGSPINEFSMHSDSRERNHLSPFLFVSRC